ncbi:uncharacterized protein CEXT_197391 [Caerostris extrusa]|uniref:Uncharacterized protein n=1 Tax=Caerostris extrusa TaxID=172846 RepID=A0AAV4S418_CAEEX|nr:uncharacterized protein CEXT_197391 [Caerostris extrusa]
MKVVVDILVKENMKNWSFKFVFICCVLVVTTRQQNSTDRGPARRDSVMNAIQQIQIQLNSLETEGQRHTSKIQDVLRATTRLESQRQEFIGILDRSESHLSQRLEDVKGDIRKVPSRYQPPTSWHNSINAYCKPVHLSY